MKTIKRIVDAKILLVETVTDEDAEDILAAKDIAEKNVADTLQKLYNAANVVVDIYDRVESEKRKSWKDALLAHFMKMD